MRAPGFEPGPEAWQAYLKDFEKFALKFYSETYAKKCIYWLKRIGLKIIEDPQNAILLADLSPNAGRYTMCAIAMFGKFLKLYGITLPVTRAFLKQFAKKETPRFNIFEEDEDIIEVALNMLEKKTNAGRKFFAVVGFFTGLRIPELIYMFANWDSLRKKTFEQTTVVELNYFRRSKNAYLTMMPYDLAEKIKQRTYGKNIGYHLSKAGIKMSIMRKAHTAILSRTMMPHEIDLLQGRLTSILIRHYVKHLREIARKYWKAYREYYVF